MKLLQQIGILFFVCLGGELVAQLLPIPFPASVLSLVLLLIFLLSGLLRLEQIEDFGGFLLANMPFFFIPAGLGIMENFAVIQNALLPIAIITLVTTVLTFGATALTVRGVIALQERGKKT